MKRLNNFRSEEFDNVKVDWDDNGGISIDQCKINLNNRRMK